MEKIAPFIFLKTPKGKLYEAKRILILSVLCILSVLVVQTSYAQDSLQVLHTIPIEAKNIAVDKLGNIYALTPQNDLVKYNKLGEKQFEYSENRLGDVSVLEVKNPLEILLYYADFQILKTLDRTLSEIQTLDLTSLQIFQIPVLCASSDGNIWLFDQDNQRLLKINRQGKSLFQSSDLRLRFQQNLSPTQIMEIDNQVYMNVPSLGIIQFDAFGNFQKKLDFPNLDTYQIQNSQLYFINKKNPQEVLQIDTQWGKEKTIFFPNPLQKAIKYQQKWIVLNEDRISVFQ